MSQLRVGTRGSALAVAQTTTVADALSAATGRPTTIVTVRTEGDVSTRPLAQLGGTGVFAAALRRALLDGECDLVVHSLKDLPTTPEPGLVVAAHPARADARDALCARDGLTLAALPASARVGTGSPRRVAQLLARRPDLQVIDVRGNVDTRLGKVAGGELDAVVLAAAGLDRIGRSDAATERFDLAGWPTAPGQGALAVEVRAGEESLVAMLDDPATRVAVEAERRVLALLEAGCSAPVGVHAWQADDELRLEASVYSLDGSQRLSSSGTGSHDEVEALAARVVGELLDAGAARLTEVGS
jgi:hydroxymethylbilane synthase